MLKKDVKEGDIVLVKGWGISDCVIGRVCRVEEKELWLEWPDGLNPYGFCNPQPFATFADPGVDVFDRTTVLSTPNAVFEKMLELLSDKLEIARTLAVDAVTNELGRIPPYGKRKTKTKTA